MVIGTPLIILGIVIGGVYAWSRYFHGMRSVSVKIAPIAGIAAILVLTLYLYDIIAFFKVNPWSGVMLLDGDNWLRGNVHYLLLQGAQIIFLCFEGWLFYAFGRLVSRIFSIRLPAGGHRSFSVLVFITIGMFWWMLFAFGLAAFGMLKMPILAAAVVSLVFLEWKSVAVGIRWMFSRREVNMSLVNPEFLLWIIIAVFLSINLVDGLRPIPTGYDDMTYYMNRANLISERSALVNGGNPYPFELIVASFRIFASSMTLGMSLGLFASIVGGFAVYGFGKYLFGRMTGLISLAIWGSMPMTFALIIGETKPDVLLFFLSSMMVWTLFVWMREKHIRYFLIAVFLFGFSITVKLTAAFLLAPLLLAAWHMRKDIGIDPYRRAFLVTVIFLLPILPWIIYGYGSRGWTAPRTISEMMMSSNPNSPIAADTFSGFGIDASKQCRFVSADQDYGRYEGNGNRMRDLLLLPWDITMNTRVSIMAAEVGFLFLALIPALILKGGSRVGDGYSASEFRLLVGMAVGYWVLWGIFSRSGPWYGFPGFLFLSIFAAISITRECNCRWFRVVLWSVLFFGLSVNGVVRLEFSGKADTYRYAAGFIDQDGFIDERLPGYKQLADTLNEHKDTNVLMTASRMFYFVKDNDRRVILDSVLDTFDCLDLERNDALTLGRLRALHVGYMLIGQGFLTADTDVIRDRAARFEEFAKANLANVTYDQESMLFKVPQ